MCWRVCRGDRISIWKDCFQENIALAETEHEDFEVWKGELSGEFSVRSAYKLLQDVNLDPRSYLLQTETKDFYKKLWNLQLPSKIAFTIWRFSWDFIPNFANLRFRRIVTNDSCPRCRSEVEGSLHVFRDCPIATGSSRGVIMAIVVFSVLRCGGYGSRVRILFDAAYDDKTFRSASGLVGWDLRGNSTVLKTVIHSNVPSSFAAEAYACLDGTKLGISLRYHSVKLMGDSRTVIRKCQETTTDKSVIRSIIRDIQSKKSDFQELIFQYIHRSKNFCAHRLAKNALGKGETTYLRGEELDGHTFASVEIWPRNPD